MGKREDLIERMFEVLWPVQDWGGEEAACRNACAVALDAILAGLKEPSEEMVDASWAPELRDMKTLQPIDAVFVWKAMLSTLEETKP